MQFSFNNQVRNKWKPTQKNIAVKFSYYLQTGASYSLVGKESDCNAGGLVWPRVGEDPREGNGSPPKYSRLENPMTEVLGGLPAHGLQESDTTERPRPSGALVESRYVYA